MPSSPIKNRSKRGRISTQSVPFWDSTLHTLWWRGKPLKHFRAEAPSQEAILSAFERAAWPLAIEFRVADDAAILNKVQVRNAVHNLNRAIRGVLRFRQEGNGRRVLWENAARRGRGS